MGLMASDPTIPGYTATSDMLRTHMTAIVEDLHDLLAERWPDAKRARQTILERVVSDCDDLGAIARMMLRLHERDNSE